MSDERRSRISIFAVGSAKMSEVGVVKVVLTFNLRMLN